MPDTLTQTDTTVFAVDPSHSRVGFSVRHMGFTRVHGSFGSFDGEIRMSDGDPATIEAEATIQTASITTNDEKRDEHLRSADFFDAVTHPTVRFRSAPATWVSDQQFTLIGDLTMHGVTASIQLDGNYLGESVDPWGNARVGFEAKGKINRKDFGLNWNSVLEAGGLLVSEQVEIVLDIQAVRK
jgi:polyisoprenoid-binding protein YceI